MLLSSLRKSNFCFKSKEIVTRMGGEISAVSEAGSGSTFTVAIPLQTT